MVRALARERLDDIADPFRKLSQDLLRFLSSRRPVHERLAAYSRVNNGSDNRCDFNTVNRQTTNRVLDAARNVVQRTWVPFCRISPQCNGGREVRIDRKLS